MDVCACMLIIYDYTMYHVHIILLWYCHQVRYPPNLSAGGRSKHKEIWNTLALF